MGELKNDLETSLRKSIAFLRERYPNEHPLLASLKRQLASLIANRGNPSADLCEEKLPLEGSCCDRHETCPFFQAVETRKDMDDVLKEYVSVYCCGPVRKFCFRLKHLRQHGSMPPENVSPTGDTF